MTPQTKVLEIIKILKKVYPSPKTALNHKTAFELLVATILSAQCTDKRVNLVTPELFKKYSTPEDFAKCPIQDLEKLIRTTGFYHNKSKNIKNCSLMLLKDFNGEVPQTMEELITLPGVGRKTANVLLGNFFNKIEGICIDTHMIRLSQRIGLSKKKEAVGIEQDLMKITPHKDWTLITNLLIPHGRTICFARKPRCEICPISHLCSYFLKNKS